MKKMLFTMALLCLAALAVANNSNGRPVEVPGDDATSSSTGYHNTELNSAGPSTDFSSTIIRSQKEEVIELQKKRRAEEKNKKKSN